MNESDIEAFWQRHPCGEAKVGGLQGDYEAFFAAYDAFRYSRHRHLLPCLDAIAFRGRDTLEIGLGQGADAEQMIRRGAEWYGVDLTTESVNRVLMRLEIRKLKYRALKQGSVLSLPFADDSFDIVFSHGVLHHVPDIVTAQNEIWRVLRPGGVLIVMLYARWSLNYLVSIAVLRRLGLLAMLSLRYDPGGVYGQHIANARELGLGQYLRLGTFVHRNTDGPLNPYSKVYGVGSVRRDFPSFSIERVHKEFMHAPPLPVRHLPLARLLGWHLWVHLRPLPAEVLAARVGR